MARTSAGRQRRDGASAFPGVFRAGLLLSIALLLAAGCRLGAPRGLPEAMQGAVVEVPTALPVPPPPAPSATALPEAAAVPASPSRCVCSGGQAHAAGATVAVVGVDAGGDPQLAGFQALWDAVRILCPRHTVILGEVDVSVAGQLRTRGLSVPLAGLQADGTAVAFPGLASAASPPRLRVDCGHWRLLFLSSQVLERRPQEEALWLEANTRSEAAAGGVILFCDRPLWDTNPGAWGTVKGILEAAGGGYVLCAGSERFSWWRDGRLQCQSIRPATAPAAAPRSVADGEFTGLVWIALGAAGPDLRVIDPVTVQPPEVFARHFQDERRALRESCQAGAVSDGEGVTEVRCGNPTAETLAFDAEWHFEGNAGRVEPQMLGFSLGPGQTFRQRFRLQTDGTQPLKFARPRLVLETLCRDGLGQPVPLRLELVPQVRLGGPLGALGSSFNVDGDLADWPFSGLPLNHSSQVLEQREPWRGENDLSGIVYVGEQAGWLGAAVRVRRRPGEAVGCRLLVDPRGAEGADYGATAGPVTVTVSVAGQVEILGAPADAVRAAWKPAEDGGVLEIALSGRAFDAGELPATVLADAVLTRYGVSGEPVTSLCLSGDDPGLRSSRLYARFQRAAGAVAPAGSPP